MKKNIILFAFITLAIIKGYAQYTFSANTYYLIPPTSGCNGIWAIKDTLNCPTFSVSPFDCAQFSHINGDTIFLQLCAIPCEFYTSGNGNTCLQAVCALDNSTIVNDYIELNELFLSFQDPNTFLLKNTHKTFDKISITTIHGQSISEHLSRNQSEDIIFNTENWPKGFYLLIATKNEKVVLTEKIIKN